MASVFEDRFNQYKGAVVAQFDKITKGVDGAKKKPVLDAYTAYLNLPENAAKENEKSKAKSFAEWLKTEPTGTVAAATAGLDPAAQDVLIHDVDADKKMSEAFETFSKDARDVASGIGGWLGKNWPMLAAIVVPLLAGNFLDLGTLPMIGVGIASVVAAAAFSDDDSMLGQAKNYVMTAIGFKKAPTPAGPGTETAPPTPPKEKAFEVIPYGLDKGVAISYSTFDVDGKTYNVTLEGKMDGAGIAGGPGAVSFTQMVLHDKDNKVIGAPKKVDIKGTVLVDGAPPVAKIVMAPDQAKIDLFKTDVENLARAAKHAVGVEELKVGKFTIKSEAVALTDPAAETAPVTFTVTSATSPDATRTFKGTLSKTGELKVTDIQVNTQDGKSKFEPLAKPMTFASVGKPMVAIGAAAGAVPASTLQIDEVELAKATAIVAMPADAVKFTDFVVGSAPKVPMVDGASLNKPITPVVTGAGPGAQGR